MVEMDTRYTIRGGKGRYLNRMREKKRKETENKGPLTNATL